MFSVLEENGFLKPTRVLTGKRFHVCKMIYNSLYIIYPGFIFGAEALSAVGRSVTKLLRNNPEIIYLLDRE
jgi:hypothetical protein